MKGHAQSTTKDRTTSFEELKQEIQGRLPSGPFEFSEDFKDFKDIEPSNEDTYKLRQFKRAVVRDAKYTSAGGNYLRVFGLSQSLRSLFDGSVQVSKLGEEL